ncbi:MAG: SAM-dependent methyltransferase [Candidatus Hodarchaeales archaeon]|jgi:cyclopropane fatty-acyl-phospholipid synthase-like methyltransferase
MSSDTPEWDIYARNTLNPLIQAYYYFTVWRNYRLLLHGLNIQRGTLLELGSSSGQISFRLSRKYNFSPTLVDTSAFALRLANQNYRNKGIIPITIKKSILDLNLGQKYDFVHSHGLLEHFIGKKRQLVLSSHINHVHEGGWLVCWIPCPDVFYRINRWYLERTGQWIFGFEQPFKMKEILTLFKSKSLVIQKIYHLPGWIGVASQLQ